MLIYGLGGLIVPFLGIKLIDMIVQFLCKEEGACTMNTIRNSICLTIITMVLCGFYSISYHVNWSNIFINKQMVV